MYAVMNLKLHSIWADFFFFFFAESPEPDRHICSSRGIFHLHRSKAHISETRFPIENPSLKSTSEFPG